MNSVSGELEGVNQPDQRVFPAILYGENQGAFPDFQLLVSQALAFEMYSQQEKKELEEIAALESHIPVKHTILGFELLLPSSELSSAMRDHDLDFLAQ